MGRFFGGGDSDGAEELSLLIEDADVTRFTKLGIKLAGIGIVGEGVEQHVAS